MVLVLFRFPFLCDYYFYQSVFSRPHYQFLNSKKFLKFPVDARIKILYAMIKKFLINLKRFSEIEYIICL